MKFTLLLVCLVAQLAFALENSAENDGFERDEGIVVLTGENFQKALDYFDNLLVEFYAPWCGHCKAFAPEYVKIALKLEENNQNATCAKVDAPEEQGLIERYGIEGFPTLKLFRKGKKPESYQGFRNVDFLVDWVTRKIAPPAVVLEEEEAADKFKDSADVNVVAYIKDPASNESLTFSEVADEYDDYEFAIIHKENVATKLGFAKEGIKLFKKFDGGEVVDYDQDLTLSVELKKFIQANSLPPVVTFDQRNAQKIFGGDIKAHNLLFISKTDSKTNEILEEFEKSAKEFKTKVLFVVIDSDQDEHERIIEYFGLKKDELPGLRFIKLQEEMTKYKYPFAELVAENITLFVNGVLEGTIKPHLLTQELPEDWDKNPVKVLVGTNFDDVVFDKNSDVLVEFYAPWCGHCKALAPIYEQLGEKYKDRESVVIAKMDAASNELEHTRVNSYPTIKLYKRDTNEVVEYNGERTLEGLSKFIETRGDYGRAAPDYVTEEADEPEVGEDGKQADKHDEL